MLELKSCASIKVSNQLHQIRGNLEKLESANEIISVDTVKGPGKVKADQQSPPSREPEAGHVLVDGFHIGDGT